MFRRLLAVVLLLSCVQAQAIVAVPQVYIDEAFDASRGVGTFGIINQSSSVVVAFAVGNDTVMGADPTHELYHGWASGVIGAAAWDAALNSIHTVVPSAPAFATAFPGYQTAVVYWANDWLTPAEQVMVASLGWNGGTLGYDGSHCNGNPGCRSAVMPGDDMSHANLGELGFWFFATSANSPFVALGVNLQDQSFSVFSGMTTPVPEPGAMLLMVAGLFVVGLQVRRAA